MIEDKPKKMKQTDLHIDQMLQDLLLHVKNMPDCRNCVQHSKCAVGHSFCVPMNEWHSELVGKTQELCIFFAERTCIKKQFKDLIDDIPINMEKAGENYEVYSVGTKKKWIAWLVRYNQVLFSNGDNLESVAEKEASLRKRFGALYKKIGEYSVDSASKKDMLHFDVLGVMLDELNKEVFSAGLSRERRSGSQQK